MAELIKECKGELYMQTLKDKPAFWVVLVVFVCCIVVVSFFSLNQKEELDFSDDSMVPTIIPAMVPTMIETIEPELETQSQVFDPRKAIVDLFDAGGGMNITLYTADTGAYNTYSVTDRWYAERYAVVFSGYEWEEIDMPSQESSDFWITIISTDGLKNMIFLSGDVETLHYKDGENSTYLIPKPLYKDNTSITLNIRAEYDGLDISISRVFFYISGSAEDAAESFVYSVYGTHLLNLAPDSMYNISDYDVVKWGIKEKSISDDAIVGWFTYAVVPKNYDSPGHWPGNTVEGEDEYEGWLVKYREFVLQKQEDGYWKCIGFGTGGYSLPE